MLVRERGIVVLQDDRSLLLVSPFSSVFSVVLLNFFHQDANSRLDGGEAAASEEGAGAGAPRCEGRSIACGGLVGPVPFVVILATGRNAHLGGFQTRETPLSSRRRCRCAWSLLFVPNRVNE